ncbi:hypothetical protein BDQ17DRAFT_1361190 [Cyathus striatus]|nr:hypothetical protein BDQ17DRAFT_1361190 [Cyathus striatus]
MHLNLTTLLFLFPFLALTSAQEEKAYPDIYTLPKPAHGARQLSLVSNVVGSTGKGLGSLCNLVPQIANVPGVGVRLCQQPSSSSDPSTQDVPQLQNTYDLGTGGPIPAMQQMCKALDEAGEGQGALVPFCSSLDNPVQGLKDLCGKLGDRRSEFGLCAGVVA